MPYSRSHLNVKVQNRSGFDKSHRNSGTLKCGSLVPLLCDEVIPNSRVSLRLNLTTQLPPLVSDTYMNVKLKAEAFFVPLRLCCGSFEDFFCDVPSYFVSYTGVNPSVKEAKMRVPYLDISVLTMDLTNPTQAGIFNDLFGPGSLMDYLGCRWDIEDAAQHPSLAINPMPLVAYGLVYQEWYRNPRVQRPLFIHDYDRNLVTNVAYGPSMMDFPFHHYPVDPNNLGIDLVIGPTGIGKVASWSDISAINPARLADGSTIFDLRQRNFPLDYFTGARVSAQQGDEAFVRLELPEGAESTSFSIAQLRAANSLQQFRERNNLPSSRLVDQVKARYGASLSDGVSQRPICIGSATYDVNSSGVSQTGGTSDGSNPFDSVAAQYGRAYGAGSDFLISDFTANEPGYIMVLVSLVPEVTYSSFRSRIFRRYTEPGSITDMACSLLQNVGDQPIYASEVTGLQAYSWKEHIFGFQDRYADFMFIPNSCHGEFVDGRSLSSFVLQRTVVGDAASPGTVDLSSDFLQIPTDYLDPVMVASAQSSGVSAWYDSVLQYKVSMPLAEFSIPSLQDPAYEHGRSVSLRRNGQIF